MESWRSSSLPADTSCAVVAARTKVGVAHEKAASAAANKCGSGAGADAAIDTTAGVGGGGGRGILGLRFGGRTPSRCATVYSPVQVRCRYYTRQYGGT